MKQEEENIDKLLGKYGNGQPFRVPGNYFETFADRLKVRIQEEETPVKHTLFFYLRPALTMAASIAAIGLLVYVPLKKYFPASEGYVSRQNSKVIADTQSNTSASADLISCFSEGQFLSAVSEMKAIEADTLSNDELGEYIAANYSDLEIIANN